MEGTMSNRLWLNAAFAFLILAGCSPAAAPAAKPTAAPAAPAAPAPAAAPKSEASPAAAAPAAKPDAAKPEADKPDAAAKAGGSDYFAGKTINVIAGSSAGGGTDTINRLVA